MRLIILAEYCDGSYLEEYNPSRCPTCHAVVDKRVLLYTVTLRELHINKGLYWETRGREPGCKAGVAGMGEGGGNCDFLGGSSQEK